MNALPESSVEADRQLLRAAVRINALIFGALLGSMTGLLLFALALASSPPSRAPSGLVVTLISVFLPGYGAGWRGAAAGLAWGFVIGSPLGSSIYWINYRNLLPKIDDMMATVGVDSDLPAAILRLHGPSLGLAMGTIGALGLIATTNWLVIRGTAAESIHAGLLSEILPGYAVSTAGSIVGAADLFLILYVLCMIFAQIYNRIAASRRRGV